MIFDGMSPYGVLIAAGLLCAGFLACFLARKKKLSIDDTIILLAYIYALGIAGAKLLYLAVHIKTIDWSRITDWDYLSALLSGGFVFYGGFAGGLAAMLIVRAAHKIDTFKYIKVIIPALPLAHGLGRVGCYLAGCCYGVAYSGPLSVVYESNAYAPNGVHLFPVQLLEACICFVIAGYLTYRVLKYEVSSEAICRYMLCYGVCRFFLEFLRDDSAQRGIFGVLSTSQWISIILCVAAVVLILRDKTKIIEKT